MGFENDHTLLSVEYVKITFLQLLWCYKIDFIVDLTGGKNSNIVEKFQYDNIFNLWSKYSDVNKGIVKSMLIKFTKPNYSLFAVLCQLIGTSNDDQKKLYHIAGEVFETCTQKIILLLDKVTGGEGEKINRRALSKHTLPTLVTKPKYSTTNLHILLPHKIYSKIQFTHRPWFMPLMRSVILDNNKSHWRSVL